MPRLTVTPTGMQKSTIYALYNLPLCYKLHNTPHSTVPTVLEETSIEIQTEISNSCAIQYDISPI